MIKLIKKNNEKLSSKITVLKQETDGMKDDTIGLQSDLNKALTSAKDEFKKVGIDVSDQTLKNTAYNTSSKSLSTQMNNVAKAGKNVVKETSNNFKNVKAVFNKERTTDVKDPNSDIDIVSNYWDDHSFQISTKLESQKEDKSSSVYLSFGKSNRTPYLQDVKKNKLYSSILLEDRRLSLEEKSSIELVYQKNINYTRYKWKYFFK